MCCHQNILAACRRSHDRTAAALQAACGRILTLFGCANGVDDGGRAFDSQPPGDDIVLGVAHEGGKNK